MKTSLQDVLKTFWRRVENVLKTSWRQMTKTNILVLIKTSSKDVWLRRIYSSWSRRLEDVFWRRRRVTSPRRLHQDECLLGTVERLIIYVFVINDTNIELMLEGTNFWSLVLMEFQLFYVKQWWIIFTAFTATEKYLLWLDLQPSVSLGWWVGVRGFHLPSHMSHWSCGHVISRVKIKVFYLHFHKTYKHQTWHSSNLDYGASTCQGLLLAKSHVPLTMWSRDATWQHKSITSSFLYDL